jgi:glycosyltransferase involved in cell wall biosynthesis
MKVLQINQSDIIGGAGIAGYRLHQGLLNKNIESKLLVGNVKTEDKLVQKVPRQGKLATQISQFTNKLGFNYIHLLNTFEILKHSFYKEADILNFHNLHSGYFNYLAIPQLTEKKPAVYTLHDMWSFTGHCAYSYDCNKWQTGCGNCPYPDTYPKIRRDSTKWEWKLKNWVYEQTNLTIVTPSKWLAEQAKLSMLNRFEIHCIPNGIETNAYQPLEQENCRQILGISQGKKVLMFAADSLRDSRKGGDLLKSALLQLPKTLKEELVLLIMGSGGENIAKTLEIETVNLGYLTSDRLKSMAYSAADLFIFPTRADNLPLVLQESMACGTPMISFDIGGVADLVRQGVTGYLAKSENASDFATGIMELLEDNNLRKKMGENSRRIALEEYPLELQVEKYIELYSQILRQ